MLKYRLAIEALRTTVLNWLSYLVSSCRQMRTRRLKAWTLIELLLVLAILGTLMGMAVPLYHRYLDKARNTKAISDVNAISRAVMDYMIDHGAIPPDTLDQVGWANHLDPWGRTYEYLRIEGKSKNEIKGKWRKDRWLVPLNSDYDLYSKGKDGKSRPPLTAKHSRDDIVRANNGGYIGLGSDY